MVAIKKRIMQLAGTKVSNAIKLGKLKQGQECILCGRQNEKNNSRSLIEGHHPDYRKPLFVIWLCHICHRQHHSDLTAADFYVIGEIVKTYLLKKNQRIIEERGLLRGRNKRFFEFCY